MAIPEADIIRAGIRVFSDAGGIALRRVLGRLPDGGGPRKRKVGRDTNAALTGRWAGRSREHDLDQAAATEYDITWDMTSRNGHIRIRFSLTVVASGRSYTDSYSGRGSVGQDSFIRFEYSNLDSAKSNFGDILMQLDPKGQALAGRFMGCSAEGKGIVSGEIELSKIP